MSSQPRVHPARSNGAELVLGIDGGGSRTVALLSRANGERDELVPSVLGRGEGGPSNYQAVGCELMERSLEHAVAEAFAAAGVERSQVAAACLGLAGADRPGDHRLLHDWSARTQLASRVSVVSDGRLVLAGGTSDDWGVGVIAGTGSFALARSPAGHMRRAGGWGYLFGDEGSAYAIALAGLRAVACAYDGSAPDTSLTVPILDRLHITDVKSMVPAVYGGGLGRTEIARLAHTVTEAAETGDPVALRCLDEAADQLAVTACAAAKLLVNESFIPFPVALAGGLLTSCCLYSDRLLQRFRYHVGCDFTAVTRVSEPAIGAVRLARRSLGPDVPASAGQNAHMKESDK